jgi:ATP/maltotriose-dependent transcriptional regulator MalT
LAIKSRDAAFALADEIKHPFSLSTATVFATMLSLDMRDQDGSRAYAAMLASRHDEYRAKATEAPVEAFGGYVEVLDGRPENGISRVRRALDELREADHAPGMRACLIRILLEACSVAGDAQTGLEVADNALASRHSARLWDAEIRRLRAEFLAALGAPFEDLEEELERALATARDQGAKMLELRAAMSLLRSRQERGDTTATRQARSCLAAIVEAIPEGSHCQDLRDAAVLLRS